MADVLHALKKKFKNHLPFGWTKFPLTLIVFRVVSGTQVAFRNSEPMRRGTNSQGDACYILKYSSNEILVPKAGVETPAGDVLAVEVSSGDYKFVNNVSLDEASKNLVFSLADDETMKYQFANICKEAAFRYRPEEKWFSSFTILLLIFGVICIIMVVITQTTVGESVASSSKNLVSVMKELTSSVSSLGSKLPGLPGQVIPSAPPV